MKILFLTFGPTVVASSRTRVFQYLPFFIKDKIKFKVITYNPSYGYTIPTVFLRRELVFKIAKSLYKRINNKYNFFYSFFQTVRFLSYINRYDIIFIQKVLLPTSIIERIKNIYKKPIIFDFDDAIYAGKPYDKQKFDQQIPLYDLIILENSFTKQYVNEFGNDNIIMITGPIDCNRYYSKVWTKKDKIIIGWIGSLSTQKYLTMLKNTFKRLNTTYKNLIFELIGAQNIDFDGVPIRLKRWSLDNEVKDLQNFDIGIAPLPDNEWTRGKGGYKLLQYMAIGIPCVASPVGINRELVKDGENGFLAETEDEWFKKLSILIESPELRRDMGIRGRDLVVKNYSLEVAAPKLISGLKQLVWKSYN
ncbi:MAG: glycosyltransferase family 4 protein [bacterium]|nr:glycosyltransferase family 4 protein [bacterium]